MALNGYDSVRVAKAFESPGRNQLVILGKSRWKCISNLWQESAGNRLLQLICGRYRQIADIPGYQVSSLPPSGSYSPSREGSEAIPYSNTKLAITILVNDKLCESPSKSCGLT